MIRVKKVKFAEKRKCFFCESWLEHWLKHSNRQPGNCKCCEKKLAEVGGHVEIANRLEESRKSFYFQEGNNAFFKFRAALNDLGAIENFNFLTDSNYYIIPLCNKCNNLAEDSETFFVESDDLVKEDECYRKKLKQHVD